MSLFIFLAEKEFFYEGRTFPGGKYFTSDRKFIAKSQSMIRVIKVLKGKVNISDLDNMISFDYIRKPMEEIVEEVFSASAEETIMADLSNSVAVVGELKIDPVVEEEEILEEIAEEIVDKIVVRPTEEKVIEEEIGPKEDENVQDEKENELNEDIIKELSEELASEE